MTQATPLQPSISTETRLMRHMREKSIASAYMIPVDGKSNTFCTCCGARNLHYRDGQLVTYSPYSGTGYDPYQHRDRYYIYGVVGDSEGKAKDLLYSKEYQEKEEIHSLHLDDNGGTPLTIYWVNK